MIWNQCHNSKPTISDRDFK